MTEIGMQLKRIAQEIMDMKRRYTIENIPPKDETLFFPIRHFNSDTPITPGLLKSIPYNITDQPVKINYGGCMTLPPTLIGGGYFLWHNGQGIAIDPGFGFVDSLHRYHDLNVHCIHAVIITHDHLDHHADLETIINLRRGNNDVLKIYTNRQVSDVYGLEQRENIDGLNLKVFTVFESVGIDYRPEEIIENVTAKFLPALHWQRLRTVEKKGKQRIKKLTPIDLLKIHFNTFGVQLIINNDKKILITSDTLFPIIKGDKCMGYCDNYDDKKVPYIAPKNAAKLGWKTSELYRKKDEILSLINKRCKEIVNVYKNLDKTDIICLHIGSLEKGFSNIDAETMNNEDIFKERKNPEYSYWGFHLGLMGSIRLMELLISNEKFDPHQGIIILSEFGEELLGNRQNLCVIFSRLIKILIKEINLSTSSPTVKVNDKKNKNSTEILPMKKSEKQENNTFPVLPSEVTLKLRIDHKQKGEYAGVMCSYCGRYHSWMEAAGHEGPGEIISYVAKGPKDRVHTNCAYWNI